MTYAVASLRSAGRAGGARPGDGRTGRAAGLAGRAEAPAGRAETRERAFPARPEQVRAARCFTAAALAGCPVADDAVLCVSELATNSVIHSATARWGGAFTVRVEIRAGDYVWLEVTDEGGPWRPAVPDERLHGLEIVRELASESGIAGGPFTGWVAWARLDWPGQQDPGGPPNVDR